MAALACQLLAAFEVGGAGLQFPLFLGIGIVGGLQVVDFGHQFVLGELQGVGPCDERQQSPLMNQVVEDHHFAAVG